MKQTVTELLAALQPFFIHVENKVTHKQGGVPTFFDAFAYNVKNELSKLDPHAEWESSVNESVRNSIAILLAFQDRLRRGRLISWSERKARDARRYVVDPLVTGQGAIDCLTWKGMPLFKTAFEYSIYPMMLWELRPATIVELGSGTGASAIWLADMIGFYGAECHIYSIDIVKPNCDYRGVTFIQGDVHAIDDLSSQFAHAPKPWLIIEDAHMNVPGVLASMHRLMQSGDYLVVEDSMEKDGHIQSFMDQYEGNYRVDTRYVDFFGLNVTSALNSVFVKI